eukprot:119069-Hanusia_phi.AAC.4
MRYPLSPCTPTKYIGTPGYSKASVGQGPSYPNSPSASHRQVNRYRVPGPGAGTNSEPRRTRWRPARGAPRAARPSSCAWLSAPPPRGTVTGRTPGNALAAWADNFNSERKVTQQL